MNDTNEILEGEIVEENKAVVLSEIKYPVNTNQINALLNEYADIPDINPNNENEKELAEQFDFVLKGHKRFVKLRGQIEKTRKALKDPSLTYGKTVDGIAKEFQAMIKDTETKLHFQRKLVEDNEARKQREAEELEETRISNIKATINRYKMLPMECIGKSTKVISEVLDLAELPTVEALEEFYDEALIIYDASMTQIRVMLDNQKTVENAQEIQAERDEERKQAQQKEDKKLQDERDLLAEQQAQFNRDKKEFDDKQKAIQEAADLEKASKEADELQEKQRLDKENQIKIDEENHDKMVLETMKVLNSVSDNVILLDMIISNEVPNLYFGSK